MAEHSDAGGASRPLPLGRSSAMRLFIRVRDNTRWTHTEDDMQVTGDVDPRDLDGYLTPFVCTLRYICKAPASGFHGTFRAVRYAHRLRDHPMSAAGFAKLIEQR
jgi:hypothetical protein